MIKSYRVRSCFELHTFVYDTYFVYDYWFLTCLLQIPSDLRNYATQVPDIGDSLCAVVDFDGSDAALKAVRELKEKYNDTGMRLALLGNLKA